MDWDKLIPIILLQNKKNEKHLKASCVASGHYSPSGFFSARAVVWQTKLTQEHFGFHCEAAQKWLLPKEKILELLKITVSPPTQSGTHLLGLWKMHLYWGILDLSLHFFYISKGHSSRAQEGSSVEWELRGAEAQQRFSERHLTAMWPLVGKVWAGGKSGMRCRNSTSHRWVLKLTYELKFCTS